MNQTQHLARFFRAVVDADSAPVVICDTSHTVVYLNPAAVVRYESQGGAALLGRSILECHSPRTGDLMKRFLEWFQESPDHNIVYEGPGTTEDKDVYMVALRDEDGHVIGYYEKHEYRTRETGEKFALAHVANWRVGYANVTLNER